MSSTSFWRLFTYLAFTHHTFRVALSWIVFPVFSFWLLFSDPWQAHPFLRIQPWALKFTSPTWPSLGSSKLSEANPNVWICKTQSKSTSQTILLQTHAAPLGLFFPRCWGLILTLAPSQPPTPTSALTAMRLASIPSFAFSLTLSPSLYLLMRSSELDPGHFHQPSSHTTNRTDLHAIWTD